VLVLDFSHAHVMTWQFEGDLEATLSAIRQLENKLEIVGITVGAESVRRGVYFTEQA
jgi:hypothetical protein